MRTRAQRWRPWCAASTTWGLVRPSGAWRQQALAPNKVCTSDRVTARTRVQRPQRSRTRSALPQSTRGGGKTLARGFSAPLASTVCTAAVAHHQEQHWRYGSGDAICLASTRCCGRRKRHTTRSPLAGSHPSRAVTRPRVADSQNVTERCSSINIPCLLY
jgi:hypothetical protein